MAEILAAPALPEAGDIPGDGRGDTVMNRPRKQKEITFACGHKGTVASSVRTAYFEKYGACPECLREIKAKRDKAREEGR